MPATTENLQLARPAPSDAEALLQFELKNRAYFEQWINARSPDYYSLPAVQVAIEIAQREARADLSHQFLIKDADTIVGRVNLAHVARPYFNRAELGYRIGEQFAGKGYASQAVSLVLKEAFQTLNFQRIEATVRAVNAGSVQVLKKNGFAQFGHSKLSMQLHGAWFDLLHFDIRRDESAPLAG